MLHEDMGERRAEVSSINIDLPNFWKVNFFATRTESLESRGAKGIWKTNRQHLLAITEGSRTRSIHTVEILLVNFGKTSSWQNKSWVEKAI